MYIQTFHIKALENLRRRRKILKEDKGRQNILPLMEQRYKLQWTTHQNPCEQEKSRVENFERKKKKLLN